MQQVLKYFGTQAAIARALKIKPQAVTNWGGEIPMLRQYELERITDGKLKASNKPRLTCGR